MKKIIKPIISIILILIILITSTIINIPVYADTTCSHEYEYIETKEGIAQVCSLCKEIISFTRHYVIENVFDATQLDFTKYENQDINQDAVVEITPDCDISYFVNETKRGNVKYTLWKTDYNAYVNSVVNPEDTTSLDELVVEKYTSHYNTGYPIEWKINLEEDCTYILYIDNIDQYTTINLCPFTFRDFAVLITADANGYDRYYEATKYYGNDETIVFGAEYDSLQDYLDGNYSQDVENAWLTHISIRPTAFEDNESVKSLVIDSKYFSDLQFVAGCKNLETVYVHGNKIKNDYPYNVIGNGYDEVKSIVGSNVDVKLACEKWCSANNSIDDCTKTNGIDVACALCEYQFSVDARQEHEYVSTVDEYPTCTKEGTRIYVCRFCANFDNCITEVIPPHDYEKTVVPHTCTEDGYILYKCYDCGDEKRVENGDKAAHIYDVEIRDEIGYSSVIVPPTCTEDGYKLRKCVECGAEERTENNDKALGHDYITLKTVPPTCAEDGYDIQKCVCCGDEIHINNGNKASHNYTITTVPHTCTEDGYELYECTGCGDTKKVENGDKAQHDYAITTVPHTCTEDGYELYKCTGCGDTKKIENGDKAQHDFVLDQITDDCEEFKCERCYTTEKREHIVDWDNPVWEDVSCVYNGTRYWLCENEWCRMTITETIAPVGHNCVITNEKKPTCLSSGYANYECTRCTYKYHEDYEALGHNIITEVIPPTYDTKGYTKEYCDRCGAGRMYNYVNEVKYEFTGNINTAEQDNALVFNDGKNYYVMLWNEKTDDCNFIYTENPDHTYNFTIRSPLNSIVMDNKYNNGENTFSGLPLDNLHTAYLYRYNNGKWELVQDEWIADTSLDARIRIESPYYPQGTGHYINTDVSTEYLISFDNITADSLEDIILWYKDDSPNPIEITNVLPNKTFYSWEEYISYFPTIKECDKCKNFIYTYSSIFDTDKQLIILNPDTKTEYQYCNKYEYLGVEEQYEKLMELYNERCNDNGHLNYYSLIHKMYYEKWVENGSYADYQLSRSKRLSHSTDIVVNYIDTNGNKLAESIVMPSRMFDEYSTEELEIEGYVLTKKPENAFGTVTENVITVNYIYSEKNTAVMVNYIDTEGNTLAKSDIINGKVSDKYTTNPKNFYGYELVTFPSNAKGIMAEDVIVVDYIYRLKESSVVVKYEDVTGKELTNSTIIEGKVFDTYNTEPKDINGYILHSSPNNKNGTMQEETITVTYVYDKAPVKTLTSPNTGINLLRLIQICTITLLFFAGIILMLIYKYRRKGKIYENA